jgi:PAS domain-containing protein
MTPRPISNPVFRAYQRIAKRYAIFKNAEHGLLTNIQAGVTWKKEAEDRLLVLREKNTKVRADYRTAWDNSRDAVFILTEKNGRVYGWHDVMSFTPSVSARPKTRRYHGDMYVTESISFVDAAEAEKFEYVFAEVRKRYAATEGKKREPEPEHADYCATNNSCNCGVER